MHGSCFWLGWMPTVNEMFQQYLLHMFIAGVRGGEVKEGNKHQRCDYSGLHGNSRLTRALNGDN